MWTIQATDADVSGGKSLSAVDQRKMSMGSATFVYWSQEFKKIRLSFLTYILLKMTACYSEHIVIKPVEFSN